MEGESLRERLDRERQLPVDEAVRIAETVAGALGAAQASGGGGNGALMPIRPNIRKTP